MKVWPKNDAMRKLLKHGVTPFPAEGPADWPDDTFTHRRIIDGDVTVEDPKKGYYAADEKRTAPQDRGVHVDKVKTEKPSAPDVGKA